MSSTSSSATSENGGNKKSPSPFGTSAFGLLQKTRAYTGNKTSAPTTIMPQSVLSTIADSGEAASEIKAARTVAIPESASTIAGSKPAARAKSTSDLASTTSAPTTVMPHSVSSTNAGSGEAASEIKAATAESTSTIAGSELVPKAKLTSESVLPRAAMSSSSSSAASSSAALESGGNKKSPSPFGTSAFGLLQKTRAYTGNKIRSGAVGAGRYGSFGIQRRIDPVRGVGGSGEDEEEGDGDGDGDRPPGRSAADGDARNVSPDGGEAPSSRTDLGGGEDVAGFSSEARGAESDEEAISEQEPDEEAISEPDEMMKPPPSNCHRRRSPRSLDSTDRIERGGGAGGNTGVIDIESPSLDGGGSARRPGRPMTTDAEEVRGAESLLRNVVFLTLAFFLGALMPRLASSAGQVLVLALVAWGTCLVILVWGRVLRSDRWRLRGTAAVIRPRQVQPRVSTESKAILPFHSPRARAAPQARKEDAPGPPVLIASSPSIDKTLTSSPGGDEPSGGDPFFENLYLMDEQNRERIVPNSTMTTLDNDFFSGQMLLMIRPPDADEPSPSPSDGGVQNPVASHFRGNLKRFEFQWQIRLKKVPAGGVFMGIELDEPIKMGILQRALVNTAMKFIKKTNAGFSYRFSDSVDAGPSQMTFQVGTTMDRFIATRPGESAPSLGTEIFESPDVLKRRRRGVAAIEWSTDDVYTMALWSSNFDWVKWQCLNIPGIRPFSATSVAGSQPMRLLLYTTPDCASAENNAVAAAAEKQSVPQRTIIVALEISNAEKASIGNVAKDWVERQSSSAKKETTREKHLPPQDLESLKEDGSEENAESAAETPDSANSDTVKRKKIPGGAVAVETDKVYANVGGPHDGEKDPTDGDDGREDPRMNNEAATDAMESLFAESRDTRTCAPLVAAHPMEESDILFAKKSNEACL